MDTAVATTKLSLCYHCGDSCNGSIVFNQKAFCCQGCKTVYEILHQNELCSYYDLNNAPGVKVTASAKREKFAYLEDAEVIAKLLSFQQENVARVVFYVPQIHCSSCIYLLENLYKLREGISRSTVNFGKREVDIVFDSNVLNLRQVVETLANIGYEPHINLNDIERKEKHNHLQRYYLKLGIAFFCFGNIMLLSFPEYLGIDALSESPLRKAFGYLNFVLALPVMFYCSSEFFASAWAALKHRSLNMDFPIALGILIMFVRSSYEVFSHTGAGYFDTLGSLVFLMLIGRLFQNKTYDVLSFERDYKSYFPVAVSVLEQGHETTVPLTKVKTGDRLIIRNKELIPADSILIKGDAAIDYSFVTGESELVQKRSGDQLYAGGRHEGGTIEIETLKPVSQSYLTQLWNDDAFKKNETDNLSTLATKVSRWFTPAVLLVAFGAAAYWLPTDMHKSLNAFTSVLIITCPCALALSSPFTLGNVLRILGNNKVYLKNAFVIEKLAQVKSIVFDKTGTLTYNKGENITYTGTPLSPVQYQLVKSVVYHSTHPLSRKLSAFMSEHSLLPVDSFAEIEGAGIQAKVAGHSIRIGSAKFLGVATYGPVLGSSVFVQIDGEVLGNFTIINKYRAGFSQLIDRLKEKFKLYVLSGDNDSAKDYLAGFIPAEHLVFHQQPADKLNFIKQLQADGTHVLMLGDGLNDAGAFKQANVGLALSDDVNNFSPACDGIIDAEQFENISTIISYAHDSINIIKASFVISILYNLVGIFFAVQGTMSPIVAAIIMPISSVTIILFTTAGSYFAAKRRHF